MSVKQVMRLRLTLIILFTFINPLLQAKKTIVARAAANPIIFFNYITYNIDRKEVYSFQVVKNLQTLHIYGKDKTKIILAEDYVPQSINSVKIRAKEENVPLQNIKMSKRKNFTIFFYEKDNIVTVYSTRGGKILVPRDIFNISKINFKNKLNKSVAKL